jgi:simple sugar transport system permease protein
MGNNESNKLKSFTPLNQLLLILLILGSWSIIILLSGENPLHVFYYIAKGFMGSYENLYSTLNKMFIFILTALAFSIPAWSGMWNIGGEGQLLLGGFASAWLALYIQTDILIINILLVLCFSAFVGGLWALWPAILKTKLDVHEVVTTLMSNYIVVFLTTYLVNFPYRAPESTWPRMKYISDKFVISKIGGSNLSFTFIIALVILVVIEIVRRKFIIGYECRMVGKNKDFCEQGGVATNRIKVGSMVTGGALAGLAGGMLVMGLNYTFMDSFSPGFGYSGLLIALISGNMPFIILIISFIFSALQVGAVTMNLFTNIPAEITGVLQSIMVFFIAARKSFRFNLNNLFGGLFNHE